MIQSLRFVYVDPSLQRELQDCHLDRLLSSSIYQYIHPADLDQVMTEIDPDHHLFLSNSSSHHHPSDPSRPQPQHSGLMLSSPASTAVDRKLTATHRVIRKSVGFLSSLSLFLTMGDVTTYRFYTI